MDSTPSSSASKFSSTTFDEYTQKIQKAALETTRYAAYLPADVNFHRSMDPEFSKDLDTISARLLSLTNRLLSLATAADSAAVSRDYKGKAKLRAQDDVVDNFHSAVVDCMDQLLERTDICLDEHLGRTKPPAIAINPPPATSTKFVNKPVPRGHLDPILQHASHIPKPQLSFKRKIDNSDAPWYPSLVHKYNASVPLGYDYRNSDTGGEPSIQTHPYRYEIIHFTPPARMFVAHTPTPPPPISSTSFTWVATEDDFQAMLAKLRQASEIAVDLEHHSYRTYTGFVCLMQLSTREEDWIVDTLALREGLEELNEVFTNPDVVKVFHGADSDVLWLQQDFNIYVVNLFDTFHASKLLEFPRHGLANLLEMYCDFIPDKRYQLADWRIRPLPDEMVLYARADTHFLLYIYDCLRNALIDRSQSRPGSHGSSPSISPSPSADGQSHLHTVIARSRETSLRTYQKELYDGLYGSGTNGWDTLARKWNKPLLFANNTDSVGNVQRSVYRSVHSWRDKVAREEDESVRYVLPNHHLLQIVEQPLNDLAALLSIFPSGPPPVVRKRARELSEVVREAVRKTSPSQQVDSTKQSDTTPEVSLEEESTPVMVTKWTLITTERDIWAAGQGAAAFKTKKSTLFETPTRTVGVLTASNSTLFGTEGSEKVSTSLRVSDLVSRINSTLVVAPMAPKIAPPRQIDTNVLPVEPKMEADTTGVLSTQVEVPFVPAARREPKVLDKRVDDTIVVVGNTRTKKRKRGALNKTTSEQSPREGPIIMDDEAEGQGDVSKKKTPKERRPGNTTLDDRFDETSESQKDFDFSAVPNILDGPSNMTGEHSWQKKVQSGKVRGNESSRGKFSAPHKAHREFHGGNRSHTFKG